MSDLGLYIHVPFCKHACPYCDFYKLELRDRPAKARLEFPALVVTELDLLLATLPDLRSRSLATIYMGGGTPSTLVPEAVGTMLRELRGRFPEGDRAPEVTLEANPENLTGGRSLKWRAAGVDRLSIGVQSFEPGDLRLLERLHEPATIARAVANAREAGIGNISIDLMFALPGQTTSSWLRNLEAAVALAPDHISFYGLTFHHETPFEQAMLDGTLEAVDDDIQAEMYLRGSRLLESAGFEHYEISNFARPGKRSTHNQRYWTRRDVLGLGPSAHSSAGRARWFNAPDLDRWSTEIHAGRLVREDVEELGDEARLHEALFCNLRRREGIARAHWPELHALVAKWRDSVPDPAEVDRWLVVDADHARLTTEGWLVSDAILRELCGIGTG